jgi:hypothetical protein
MHRRIVALIVAVASAIVLTQAQSPSLDRLEKKLLRASFGVQYPGSESDSTWSFVSYPDETVFPDPARFEEISGCPVTADGSTTRQGFDATFDRLTRIEPWRTKGK